MSTGIKDLMIFTAFIFSSLSVYAVLYVVGIQKNILAREKITLKTLEDMFKLIKKETEVLDKLDKYRDTDGLFTNKRR